MYITLSMFIHEASVNSQYRQEDSELYGESGSTLDE